MQSTPDTIANIHSLKATCPSQHIVYSVKSSMWLFSTPSSGRLSARRGDGMAKHPKAILDIRLLRERLTGSINGTAFIDHLAQGNDDESFFSELLK
jgi:hypothetical protein